MTSFVDRVTLHASAGGGGDGCVSVRRENLYHLVDQMAATVVAVATLF